MSAKSNISDNITKLERKLVKIQAAERKKLINENILRLEQNGDISYETVRTFRGPAADPVDPSAGILAPQGSAEDSAGANSYTEPPITSENGQQFAAPAADFAPHIDPTLP